MGYWAIKAARISGQHVPLTVPRTVTAKAPKSWTSQRLCGSRQSAPSRTIISVRELGPYLFRVVGRGLRRAAEERGCGMSVD
jgi:hypothetical protein